MKKSTKTLLIAVTVFICLLCLTNAVFLFMQTAGYAGWFKSNLPQIVWNDDFKPLQIFILTGHLVFGIAFNILLPVFMLRIITSLRSGILFPKSNTFIILAAAGCNLIYSICNTNFGILTGNERLFQITYPDLIDPLIILAFSIIYGLAARICEENRLTI